MNVFAMAMWLDAGAEPSELLCRHKMLTRGEL